MSRFDTMWWGREELMGQTNPYPRKHAPRELPGPSPLTLIPAQPLHGLMNAAPTPAHSGNGSSMMGNGMFAPDLFADMAFTQDWVLNDWEIDPGAAGLSAPLESTAYHPR